MDVFEGLLQVWEVGVFNGLGNVKVLVFSGGEVLDNKCINIYWDTCLDCYVVGFIVLILEFRVSRLRLQGEFDIGLRRWTLFNNNLRYSHDSFILDWWNTYVIHEKDYYYMIMIIRTNM